MISNAKFTSSLGPTSTPSSRYQALSCKFGQESWILHNRGCTARAKRSGPRGSLCWTPALLRIVSFSTNRSGEHYYRCIRVHDMNLTNVVDYFSIFQLECIWTPNFTRVMLRAYKNDFFVFDCHFACFITLLYLNTSTIFKNRRGN